MTDNQYVSAVNSYSHTVYRIAFHYFKNRYDAEDVLQECFLKLYRYSGTFDTPDDMKRWLIRVAINECHSFFRLMKRTRVSTLQLDELFKSNDSEDFEQSMELMQAVMSLPSKYRVVIYLHYFEGYSIKEISQITGHGESTISMQLLRSRKKLKTILQKDPEGLL